MLRCFVSFTRRNRIQESLQHYLHNNAINLSPKNMSRAKKKKKKSKRQKREKGGQLCTQMLLGMWVVHDLTTIGVHWRKSYQGAHLWDLCLREALSMRVNFVAQHYFWALGHCSEIHMTYFERTNSKRGSCFFQPMSNDVQPKTKKTVWHLCAKTTRRVWPIKDHTAARRLL